MTLWHAKKKTLHIGLNKEAATSEKDSQCTVCLFFLPPNPPRVWYWLCSLVLWPKTEPCLETDVGRSNWEWKQHRLVKTGYPPAPPPHTHTQICTYFIQISLIWMDWLSPSYRILVRIRAQLGDYCVETLCCLSCWLSSNVMALRKSSEPHRLFWDSAVPCRQCNETETHAHTHTRKQKHGIMWRDFSIVNVFLKVFSLPLCSVRA